MARPFDRLGQSPLVLGAGAGLAASLDTAAVRDEAPQEVEVLIVDKRHLVRAHYADTSASATSVRAEVLTIPPFPLPRSGPPLSSGPLLRGGSGFAALIFAGLGLLRLPLDLSLHTLLLERYLFGRLGPRRLGRFHPLLILRQRRAARPVQE